MCCSLCAEYFTVSIPVKELEGLVEAGQYASHADAFQTALRTALRLLREHEHGRAT